MSVESKRGNALEPVDRLSEILFGLIMVLSFTGSISVADADRDEVRGVLIGAIGCNLAWGIIDAVMFVMMILIERGRALTVARETRRPRLEWRDLGAAVRVFLLVFLSTFPVVIPFLFVTPLHLAMRVSNGVAIVMLYVAGHLMGRYANLRPVLTGLVMVLTGAALVAVTIALGG